MSFEVGAVTAVKIAADGWSAWVTLHGLARTAAEVTYGLGIPGSPGLAFNVTEVGGGTREVMATKVVRKPYPEEGELDHKIVGNDLVVRIALSEFVFSSSQIVGNAQPGWATIGTGASSLQSAATAGIAVENLSRVPATDGTAVANFVTPDRQLVAGTIHVEVIAGSVFAEADSEVAAVRFVATDQRGNQVSVLVDEATLSTWGKGDAKPVYSFGADISTVGLTNGDLITVRAEVIDHLGRVSTSAPNGSRPGNPAAFVDQVYRLDANGTFGKSFAYVDPNASASTGVVSLDSVVAAATPFKTIAAAMNATQNFNALTFSRTNLDNSEIRLKAGTHIWVNGATWSSRTDDVWLTITRDPEATRDQVRITGAVDGKNNFGVADHIKVEGLTIDRGPMGASLNGIMRGQADDALWLHNIAFNGHHQRAPSFQVPDIWVTQSEFTATSRALTTFSTSLNMFRFRGIEATAGVGNIINGHLIVGSDLDDFAVRYPRSAVMPGSSGSLIAYNEISVSRTTDILTLDGTQGIAILDNVFQAVSGTSPAIKLSSDAALGNVSNVVFHHNLVLNERVNVGYNDLNGTNSSKTFFSLKWNDLFQLNTKHDVFSKDPDNLGAWSVLYGVGFEGNFVRNQPAGNQSFGFAFDGTGASGNGVYPPGAQKDAPDTAAAPSYPTGNNDTFVVTEDTPLDIAALQGVLANDSAASGLTLAATIVAGPGHGALTLRADGSFLYKPSENFNGTDSFSYTATAGGLSSGPVTVNIQVLPVNDAPALNSPTSVSIAENVASVMSVAATDPDAGSSLLYSLVGGADVALFKIDPTSGALSFISAPDFEARADAGSDNIYNLTVRVSDGQLSAEQLLVVSVVDSNEKPSAQADAITVDEASITGNLWTTLLANDTDVELGDVRIIVGFDASTAVGTINFNPISQSITYTATAAAFSTLGLGQTATDVFYYTIRDSGGLTSSASVTVTVRGMNTSRTGTAGVDTLTGGVGGVDLVGLAGNDTYVIISTADRIFEGAGNFQGIDTVRTALPSYSLPINVEHLTYTGLSSAVFTGNAVANTITGGSGNDILDGGAGSDTLIGGLGNDTYIVDRAGSLGDILVDAGGTDLIKSWISWTLADGFENLELLGSTHGSGNGADNIITGNGNDNVLDGRGGADTMFGMGGNDTYFVDSIGDFAIEIIEGLDRGGTDTVRAMLDWTLGEGVENLQLINASGAGFTATGNGLANVITGGVGADRLLGLAGSDQLVGGTGNDTLDGGAGPDRLTGGQGDDVFILRKGEADGDVIADFVGKGTAVGDSILLLGWGTGSTFVNTGLSGWRITDGLDGTISNVTVLGSIIQADVFFG